MCTNNQCFKQKQGKYQIFSTEIFQLLQLRKISIYCIGMLSIWLTLMILISMKTTLILELNRILLLSSFDFGIIMKTCPCNIQKRSF